MEDKELFIAYVHNDLEWQAWIYSYGEIIDKLGVFASKQEATIAVDQWKKEKELENGNS
jgi:hypothetical protein